MDPTGPRTARWKYGGSKKDGYHEVYNDISRDEAIRDLVGWMEAVVVV